jgi:integrase
VGRPREIRDWWNAEVVAAKGRSTRTGRAYLDVLSSVLGYACDLELLERNPVPAFRETLRRRSGTKGARHAAAPGRSVKPIERPEEIESLVQAAVDEGLVSYALVSLCLDAGLRLGEALGLRWQAIEWGDDRDPNRALRIEEARPRGGEPTAPKSGRFASGCIVTSTSMGSAGVVSVARGKPESARLCARWCR